MLDKRVSLQKLEVLCMVVELGTVTRAAEQLYVAQPVVTAHIRSLEQRFGVTLFVRSGRTLELTEAGKRVYRYASEALSQARALMRELEGLDDGSQGVAVIGASMSLGSYLLPGILTEFRRHRPGAEITVLIGDPETTLHSVEQGDSDFGVVIRDTSPDSEVLEGEFLGVDDFVLVTSPEGEPAADSIPLAALEGVPMIASPRDTVRRSLEDNALAHFNAAITHPVIELGHPEALKRAVVAGLGATLLTRSAVEAELERGELREVEISDAELNIAIYSVKRRDKRLSELQTLLLDAIRVALADRSRIQAARPV